jgi:hypothetical protein
VVQSQDGKQRGDKGKRRAMNGAGGRDDHAGSIPPGRSGSHG